MFYSYRILIRFLQYKYQEILTYKITKITDRVTLITECCFLWVKIKEIERKTSQDMEILSLQLKDLEKQITERI